MRVFQEHCCEGPEQGRRRQGKGCQNVGSETTPQRWVWQRSPVEFVGSEVVGGECLAEVKHPVLLGAWDRVASDAWR